MASRWRRNNKNDAKAPPTRLAAVSGAAPPKDVGHGVAIFGPDLTAPLLGDSEVADCLVPEYLRPAVTELCCAEAAGRRAGVEATRFTLDWLLDNPSAGDVNAFALLTEICVRVGRFSTAADRRILAIRNALSRRVTNPSCRLQLKAELAKAFTDNGDVAAAVDQYEALVALFRDNGFSEGLREVLPHFAWALSDADQIPRAQDALDEWAPLATTNDEASMLWHYRASILRFVYGREDRIRMYHKSLELLDEHARDVTEGAIRVDLANALGETRIPNDAAAAAIEYGRAIQLFDSAGDVLHATRARAGLVVARVDSGELVDPAEIDAEFERLRGLRAATGDRDGHLKDRSNRMRALEMVGAPSDDLSTLRELEVMCVDARASRNLLVWATAMQRRVRLELRHDGSGRTASDPADPYHHLIAELYELSRLLRDVRAGYADPLERAQATRYFIDVNWWLIVLLLKSDQQQLAMLAADELRTASTEVEARDQVLRAAAPADVRQREMALMRQLEMTVDPAEVEQVRQELRSIRRSYRSAIGARELEADEPKTAWADRLQEQDEALLAFTCHEMGIVMFTVADKEIHARWLLSDSDDETKKLVDELYQRAREFTWSIMQAAGDNGDREQPIRHGHWLWKGLISPCKHVIGDRDLVIVADGPLHGLPWAALLTAPSVDEEELDAAFRARWATRQPEHQGAMTVDHPAMASEGARFAMWADDWKTLPYFGRDRRIRISMSVGALGRDRRDLRSSPTCRLVGVADPVAGPAGEVSDLVHRLHAGKLEPLPGARAELDGLVSMFARGNPSVLTDVLIGPRATRQTLAELIDRQRPNWLHFAAHGQVDVEQPLRSRIFLAPDETGSRADLTVEWLYANPIQATLVVLSCCETALGLTAAQEAVIGLPRAFIAGGTQTVVATLWRVPDDPRLMQTFYEGLLAGMEPEVALAEAQRSLIDESVHPVFWAGHQSYS